MLRGKATSGFNPRTRVGCDHEFFDNFIGIFRFQSTHPRGVRQMSRDARLVCHAFQSTHPRGVRPTNAYDSPFRAMFQSTHPRGVRLGKTGVYLVELGSFNPRTRVGCDTPPCSVSRTNDLFQSTHPRGVRHGLFKAARDVMQFQSTHPRGVRRSIILGIASSAVRFQSTHPRGVRRREVDA